MGKSFLRVAFALAIIFDTSAFFLVVAFAAQTLELLEVGRYAHAAGVALVGMFYAILFVACVVKTYEIGGKLEQMK